MENPLRHYIYEIGSILGKLGYDLCQQADNYQPMGFHGEIIDAIHRIWFNLHELNADLDIWRKEMLAKNGKIRLPNIFEGTDGVDVETVYWAASNLLRLKFCDNWDNEVSITDELRKLEWLCEELQNTPDVLRNSKATYDDFSFDKINSNR